MKNIFSFKMIVLAWTSFYLACSGIGRADIPQKLLIKIHHETMANISKPWGCPSIFDKQACKIRKTSNK